MILFLRSSLFNILFISVTAVMCVLCLPGLLLPRAKAMFIVKLFVNSVYFLEKNIIGLDYEVRGLEHLPAQGPYIIAAKHESPYETMKLHRLFKDPAIILKKELLSIPLWGKFLQKSGPIAIDRKAGKQSMQQIIDGARVIIAERRPIVIFPQGTRVYPWQTIADRPYKIGAARLKKETGVPLIPMALNTGMFWPKGSWLKQKGKIVFEFLPPVDDRLELPETLQDLSARLEAASQKLAQEAVDVYKVPDIRQKKV